MAAKRKRHLQYRAKKAQADAGIHEIKSVPAEQTQSLQVDAGHEQQADKRPRFKSAIKNKGTQTEYSKLPPEETRFIRRELVYIALIATAIIVLYLVIIVLFRYTQIDEWLNSLIKLGSG